MIWYDKEGSIYFSNPIEKWGSTNNYKTLFQCFEILENKFLDKGIPIIIGEAGIITKKNNATSFREFLYILFSLTNDHEGIMACLWDSPINNNNYYNRETNRWHDIEIKDIISKISTGKYIKYTDYYYMTYFENVESDIELFVVDIGERKINKIYMNTKVIGKINIDYQIGLGYIDHKGDYYEIHFNKENGKKNYDGTTTFCLDISNIDIYDFLIGIVFWGYENAVINNATVEYNEPYQYWDFELYKRDILRDIG